jgi:hypothetical protein
MRLTTKQKDEINKKIIRAPTKVKADMVRELKVLHNHIDNLKCFERFYVWLFYKNDVKTYRNSKVRGFFHTKSLTIPDLPTISEKTDEFNIFSQSSEYNRKSFLATPQIYPE